MRVIECAELLAADLFKNADQTCQRTTLGDVERPAGRSSRRLWLWPLWVGAAGDGAARLCDRQRLAASGARHQSARAALIRSRAQTAPRFACGDACDRRVFASTKLSSTVSRSRDFAGRTAIFGLSHDTGQVVIFVPGRTEPSSCGAQCPDRAQIRRSRNSRARDRRHDRFRENRTAIALADHPLPVSATTAAAELAARDDAAFNELIARLDEGDEDSDG